MNGNRTNAEGYDFYHLYERFYAAINPKSSKRIKDIEHKINYAEEQTKLITEAIAGLKKDNELKNLELNDRLKDEKGRQTSVVSTKADFLKSLETLNNPANAELVEMLAVQNPEEDYNVRMNLTRMVESSKKDLPELEKTIQGNIDTINQEIKDTKTNFDNDLASRENALTKEKESKKVNTKALTGEIENIELVNNIVADFRDGKEDRPVGAIKKALESIGFSGIEVTLLFQAITNQESTLIPYELMKEEEKSVSMSEIISQAANAPTEEQEFKPFVNVAFNEPEEYNVTKDAVEDEEGTNPTTLTIEKLSAADVEKKLVEHNISLNKYNDKVLNAIAEKQETIENLDSLMDVIFNTLKRTDKDMNIMPWALMELTANDLSSRIEEIKQTQKVNYQELDLRVYADESKFTRFLNNILKVGNA